MLDIEVIGADAVGPAGPSVAEIIQLCTLAFASAGIEEGHAAVQFVGTQRIRELNREFRDVDAATDVLSFGVDEHRSPAGPRELGDVVICLDRTRDVREAVVHGALHLTGMDHAGDEGEMLALQAELMRWTA